MKYNDGQYDTAQYNASIWSLILAEGLSLAETLIKAASLVRSETVGVSAGVVQYVADVVRIGVWLGIKKTSGAWTQVGQNTANWTKVVIHTISNWHD